MANLISLGRLIDTSFEVYKKYWKEFLGISLWLLIASLPRLVGNLLMPLGAGPAVTFGDWLSFTFSLLGSLILAVVSIWVIISLIQVAEARVHGKVPDFKAISRRSWKLFFHYVFVSILVLGVIIASSLLAAPGIILLIISSSQATASSGLTAFGTLLFFAGGLASFILIIKFSLELGLAQYALVVDDKRGVQAIRTSFSLVKGRWWATFVRYVAPKLLYLFVIVILNFLIPAALSLVVVLLAPTSIFLAKCVYVVAYLFTVSLSAVSTPLIVATDYILYDSLRNSK